MAFKDRHIICSKENPCQFCGREKFCAVNKNGKWAICTRESNGAIRTTPTGFFVHRIAQPQVGLPGEPVKPQQATVAPAKAFVTLGPPTLTNTVYSALLSKLIISANHINNLLARGLTQEAIVAGQYRSFPARDRRAIAHKLHDHFGEQLFRVPGFAWREEKQRSFLTILGFEGMFVPVRNLEGLILALKIRRDGDGNGPKYVILSSAKANGVSPGAPAHAPLGTPAQADVVRITEGELKADGAWLMTGLPTLSFPGVNSWQAVVPYLKQMQCKTVRVAFDSDAGEKKEVAFHLRACVRGLRRMGFAIELERWGSVHKGIDDLLHSGGKPEVLAGDDVDVAVDAILSQAGVEEKGDPETKSAASELVAMAMEEAELFHTEDGRAMATCKSSPRWTISLKSKRAKEWLSMIWHRRKGGAVNGEAIGSAINALEGFANLEGDEFPVGVRVAGHDDGIYLDLGDKDWAVVAIKASGWEVQKVHSARFKRARGALALPAPVPGGDIEELRQFFNLATEDDWHLLVSFLLASLRPTGPYPILCLHGEQGSAKSTTAKAIKALIDPNSSPLRAEPREARDLAIAAGNSWIVSLDNLSSLSIWLSDGLCRLSTGGGLAVRELFSDDDEALFQAQRPAILNGIEELATKADLLERSLIISLPTIADDQRRTDSSYWAAFNAARPRMLGALLDAVVVGLRNLPAVQERIERDRVKLPRMADFAAWMMACEPALGWPEGTCLQAYGSNVEESNELAIEASPIGTILVNFVKRETFWTGTITQLLDALTKDAGEKATKAKEWPKKANKLSGYIRRITPNLRKAGIQVTIDRAKTADRGKHIALALQNGNLSSSIVQSSRNDVSPYSTTNGLDDQSSAWTIPTPPLDDTLDDQSHARVTRTILDDQIRKCQGEGSQPPAAGSSEVEL